MLSDNLSPLTHLLKDDERKKRERKKVAVQGSPAYVVQAQVGGHHCDGEVYGGQVGRLGTVDATVRRRLIWVAC